MSFYKRGLSLLMLSSFAVFAAGTADSDTDTSADDEESAESDEETSKEDVLDAVRGEFESAGVHCDNPDLGICEELSTDTIEIAGEDTAKENCTTVGGKWGKGECPTANKLGHCDTGKVLVGSRNHYYKSDLFADAAAAEESCNDSITKGRWTAVD